jgi:hypothetical protein
MPPKPVPPTPAPAGRIASYPPRDANGRVGTLANIVGGVIFGIVLCMIVLVLIDGLFTILGVGKFGTISGWLAGILPVWLFIEDFRAWKGVPGRLAVLLAGGALGLIAGIAVSSVLTGLRPAFNGGISVTVACLVYAVLWFFGIRYLANRLGER